MSGCADALAAVERVELFKTITVLPVLLGVEGSIPNGTVRALAANIAITAVTLDERYTI